MIKERKLLVLDTSYSLEAILQRGIIKSVTCRDLNGYFKHVWTVHPVATLVTSNNWTSKFGKPLWHKLNGSHTFIEGKTGRFKWLKWISPVNFLFAQIDLLFTLKRLIKKENISIIRAGDILYFGLFGWLLSRWCRIPLVIRVGGNYDKVCETTGRPMQKRIFLNRKIEKKVERFVLSRADLVAGANRDNLNFALANGAKKEYSTIFRYGNLLYEEHFTEPQKRKEGESLLSEIGIKPFEFILYVGRLEKVKHPDDVIKVLEDVRKKNYDIKALLVGDGTMQEELKKIINQSRIEDYVILVGNKNQEWLSRIIPLAAVVLSPHTGRALSEVALGGSPVVAYDIDWQSEMVENNVTGILVPYPDSGKLSTGTEVLLKNRILAKQMGENLRKKALDMLDPEKLNMHEMTEYEKLLKRVNK